MLAIFFSGSLYAGTHDVILLRMAFRRLILAMVGVSPALNPTFHPSSLPGIHHIYKRHSKKHNRHDPTFGCISDSSVVTNLPVIAHRA